MRPHLGDRRLAIAFLATWLGHGDSAVLSARPQEPPPPAPAAASSPAAPGPRFFAVGDSGTGGPDQFRVAKAIFQKCAASGCDFGLLLGDNFYPDGVSSPDDPQWKTKFEQPYAEILSAGIPFYAVLGNHDYADNKDWSRGAHQLAYGQTHPAFRMPAEHYSFESGSASFLALDTSPLEAGVGDAEGLQGARVKEWTSARARPWLIAFGHHPYRSNGTNGNAGRRLARFVEDRLCGRAELYLAGHDHNLQLLQPSRDCQTLQVVSGGGGYATYALPGANPAFFQAQTLGFVYVAVDGARLTLEAVSADGEVLYAHNLAK